MKRQPTPADPSRPLTYVSLFSSAGVGCFGFQQERYECIATCELIGRRLAVQRANEKCKYSSGYVQGDLTQPDVKQRLYDEISHWQRAERAGGVDVVIATPPCQGMSVANHKKTDDEIQRNSLIVESLRIVSRISPRIFVFENVPAFLRTICTDDDGADKTISEAIDRHLASEYSIFTRTLNFKNYGSKSSRLRTLVIGVRRDLADHISPLELFPDFQPEVTLREAIGDLPNLHEMGQSWPTDIFHNFRPYSAHMRAWVSELLPGESAFEQPDPARKPHQVVDGKYIPNKQKNGDKYRRQVWDKVAPCVHTRNDQFASQNTIHPVDDRVFSIRELMRMMTVPSSFRWTPDGLAALNQLGPFERLAYFKANEVNIRQSLGEAVPTAVFQQIAAKARLHLSRPVYSDSRIRELILALGLRDHARLCEFINDNPHGLSFSNLARLAELAAGNRAEREAFFTPKSLVTEIASRLPNLSKPTVSILEPAVGTGNFLPLITNIYDDKQSVNITTIDIDPAAIEIFTLLVPHMNLPRNVTVTAVQADYLLREVAEHHDIVVGNPPFAKLGQGEALQRYRRRSINPDAQNTAAFFIESAARAGDFVAMVMPKFVLNTPEFAKTREHLARMEITDILDFGERGFPGVLIETVAICVRPGRKPKLTNVASIPDHEKREVPQSYICDPSLPYWVIYRDDLFDAVCGKLDLDIFTVFRDRQLTNAKLDQSPTGNIRVLKARNISDHGAGIIDISGYDTHVAPETARDLAVYRYLTDADAYLTPNMTYKPRVIRKPPGTLANGSAAILKLKPGEPHLTPEQICYFSSDEYRQFYRTARNRQTRSLNVDNRSVYFYGRYKGEQAA